LLEDLVNELGRRGNRALRDQRAEEPREDKVKRLPLIAFALFAAWLGARAKTMQDFLKANTVRWNTPTEPFPILRLSDHLPPGPHPDRYGAS
jgi:hypothetical protein